MTKTMTNKTREERRDILKACKVLNTIHRCFWCVLAFIYAWWSVANGYDYNLFFAAIMVFVAWVVDFRPREDKAKQNNGGLWL